jgi:hypothetical protein
VRDAALNILISSAVPSHIILVEVSVLSVEMIEVSCTIYSDRSVCHTSLVGIKCVRVTLYESSKIRNFCWLFYSGPQSE